MHNTITFIYGPEKTGKTSFAIQMAADLLLFTRHAHILMFSLEMSSRHIYERFMFNLANRTRAKITINRWAERHDNPLPPEDEELLAKAWDQVKAWHEQRRLVVLDQSPDMTDETEMMELIKKIFAGLPKDDNRHLIIIYDHVLKGIVRNRFNQIETENVGLIISRTTDTLIQIKKKQHKFSVILIGHSNRTFAGQRHSEFTMPSPHQIYGSSYPSMFCDMVCALFNPKTVDGLLVHFGIDVTSVPHQYIVASRQLSRYGPAMAKSEALFFNWYGNQVLMEHTSDPTPASREADIW